MGLIQIDRNPNAKTLRWFGFFWLPLTLAVLGYLDYRKVGLHISAVAFWIAAVAVPLLGIVSSRVLRWLWIGWMTLTYPIAFIVSHLVLLVVWYLVITPVGLLLRLGGFDPMRKKFDRNVKTYWRDYSPHTSKERYFRQF
ncbi:MAG: SxtJ family membrane protein [Candidatus Sumerlaeota bacterium]